MSWFTRLNPGRWPLARRFRRGGGNSTWVQGRYLLGFEESSFRPAGSSERWWVSFSSSLGDRAAALSEAARGEGIEVELSGDVSELGEYGHLGQYSRAFHVRDIRR